jgi:4-hydroxy-3-methylbut-2-enyl diphosphate reductase
MIPAVAEPAPDLVVAAALRLEARALRRGAPALPVLRAGMGPANARRSAGQLADSPARRIAVAGVCGGLEASQPVGEVVVATEVRVEGAEAVPCEHEALVAALRARGIEPRVGPILSVDHVVRGESREALRRTGALAVDMESAWLARAAAGRPFAVLRVVLDAPGREIARLGIALDTFRALRRLALAAPALLDWAAAPLSGSTGLVKPS